MKKTSIIFCFLLISSYCCARDKHSMWYGDSLTTDKKVDVFYLVSTNVVSAKDSAGKESLTSLLTTEDRKYMDMEFQFVKDRISGSEFNFVAPYYHQYTFDSFTYHMEKMDSVREVVGKEVCKAFDCYMRNINHGRRYILAGFSQGGDMVMCILRHMNKEQYSRMVAAYVIGFKVSAADTTNYVTIRPAKGETDTGVTVSYNTVLNTNAPCAELGRSIWDFVAGNTAVCINPVNWRTDSTPASFQYHGTHEVHIDQKYHVLVDDTDPTYYHRWMHETPPYSTSGISENCLHHWELLFYTNQIHENLIKRSYK